MNFLHTNNKPEVLTSNRLRSFLIYIVSCVVLCFQDFYPGTIEVSAGSSLNVQGSDAELKTQVYYYQTVKLVGVRKAHTCVRKAHTLIV